MSNHPPDPDFEEALEIIVQDQDKYKEKWGAWKSSYYAAILTVSSIFIAIAPFLSNDKENVEKWILDAIILLCLSSILCVVFNIRFHIWLYDKLGNHILPNNTEELCKQYEDHKAATIKFQKFAIFRKIADKAILTFFILTLILVCIIYFIR